MTKPQAGSVRRTQLFGVNIELYPLIVVIAYCVMAASQAGAPLHLDNFDFPAVAKATAESGLPIYYRGEDLPQHSGLYHPPLYIYTLAGWFNVFGATPMAARALSIVGALCSGALALLIGQTIFGRRTTVSMSTLFLSLYLLNPFALQVYAIADIDTSILPPLFLFAIWTTLRLVLIDGEPRLTAPRAYEYALVILALWLCFWSKLTTPLLLPPIIFGILATRYRVITSAALTGCLSTSAFLLFVGTYEIFGKVSGLDISFTWRFVAESLISKSVAGASFGSKIQGYAARLWSNFESFGRWDLYLVLFAAALSTGSFIKLYRESVEIAKRRWLAASVIGIGAFSVVFFYSLITLPFGGAPFKYIAPAWPLLALVATFGVARTCRTDSDISRWLIPLAAIGFLLGLLLLRDRTILAERGLILAQYAGAIVFALIAVVAVSLWSTKSISRLATPHLAAMILVAVLAGIGFGRAVAQTRVDYAKQYDYGQRGFVEARDWLIRHTSKNEVIMSMKDVASAADRRYLENYGYILGNPTFDVLEERIARLGIKTFVFTEDHGQDRVSANPAIAEWIARNTRKAATFGDYRIYQLSR